MMSMTAIWVVPEQESMTEIEVVDLQHIWELLGGYMEVARPESWRDDMVLLVDEEGLLKKGLSPFQVRDSQYGQLFGNALIVGVDSSGEFTDVPIDVEEAEDMIYFPLTD
jgi:hypothetical protein